MGHYEDSARIHGTAWANREAATPEGVRGIRSSAIVDPEGFKRELLDALDTEVLWGPDEWEALDSLLRTTDDEWAHLGWYQEGSDRDTLHKALARYQVRNPSV